MLWLEQDGDQQQSLMISARMGRETDINSCFLVPLI
eukprot:symbB.v1.2.038999.t1/scaffold6287.1/size19377/1